MTVFCPYIASASRDGGGEGVCRGGAAILVWAGDLGVTGRERNAAGFCASVCAWVSRLLKACRSADTLPAFGMSKGMAGRGEE